ncbi:MAG TPA: hypothetical protein DD811_01735, partial [Syntrophomonas sp.]|nr:hypothetical protein [Syntrophomonas sp.]
MTNLRPEGYKDSADNWEVLFQIKERNRPVAAQVGAIDYVDGQAVWVLSFPYFMGVKGYVPAQESGVDSQLVPRFIGQDVTVLIKGLDRENNMVACSRKELVEQAYELLLEQLNVGDIIPVTVRAIMLDELRHSSLMVDIGGGYLLEIPYSQARKRVSIPLRQQYTVGETVNAKVMGLDPISVSIHAALPDPWDLVDFKRGQFISGTVHRVVNGMVFI